MSEPEQLGEASVGDEIILLAACGPEEDVPSNPALPADLFTCCLTTPLRVALRNACRSELLQVRAQVASPNVSLYTLTSSTIRDGWGWSEQARARNSSRDGEPIRESVSGEREREEWRGFSGME